MSSTDRRDPTAAEMRLVRAGHHLWRQIRSLRSISGDTYSEQWALEAALEIIWDAKKKLKSVLKAESQQSFLNWQKKADHEEWWTP